MALISSYLVTTKNLNSFFNSLITAKAPDIFTQKFLENLEFKSTNDRLYIGLLKGLGFLDDSAVPTERYFKFLDQSQSKKILADAIKEAYSDLFSVKVNANELTIAEVRNKLKTLTQGKNSTVVINLMANTFKALVDYAEWSSSSVEQNKTEKKEKELQREPLQDISTATPPPTITSDEYEDVAMPNKLLNKTQLHYNIQIHLPESRDQAVYDALFRSLKKHLF
jgi:hypothetical protein